jgi:hypothetical protein
MLHQVVIADNRIGGNKMSPGVLLSDIDAG